MPYRVTETKYRRNGRIHVYPRKKQWRAKRNRGGIDYLLGSYATRKEAEEVEAEFDKNWPPEKGRRTDLGR